MDEDELPPGGTANDNVIKMTNNTVNNHHHVDLANFVAEVERFSKLIEPFAFVLYSLEDIRRWRYPVTSFLLWLAFNFVCIALSKGAVFALVSLLVISIATLCLVQLHTRMFDKILPLTTQVQDDDMNELVDEATTLETVKQFRYSILQMYDFIVKCNEYLAHFYGILKWDSILPSLRFHVEISVLLLSLVVLPTRGIFILLTNWFFLAHEEVFSVIVRYFTTAYETFNGIKSVQINTEQFDDKAHREDQSGNAEDKEDLSDKDCDLSNLDLENYDEEDKLPTSNKPGMVERLLEIKRRRQHIANESCFNCKVSFASILKRRYYCRHCGNNFCSKCCNQKVPKSVFGATSPAAQTETVLVCVDCHDLLMNQPDKSKKS